MIFTEGYPKDNGAEDNCDSMRLAGLCKTFSYQIPTDLSSYMQLSGPVRCPVKFHPKDFCQNPKTTTRDQMVCWVSGLAKDPTTIDLRKSLLKQLQNNNWRFPNTEKDAPGTTKNFPDGPDWASPSVRNHFRIAAESKPTEAGKSWLWLDVYWSCKVSPWAEPNQLIAMMKIAGDKYIQYWKANHPDWKKCIMQYWFDERPGMYNRGEKEFGLHMISVLEPI